jgi:hypothetical protein
MPSRFTIARLVADAEVLVRRLPSRAANPMAMIATATRISIKVSPRSSLSALDDLIRATHVFKGAAYRIGSQTVPVMLRPFPLPAPPNEIPLQISSPTYA